MKTIRTRRGFEAVVVAQADGDTPAVTVSRAPLTVSNEKAAAYQKAAEELGVEVVVSDDTDTDEPANPPPDGGAPPAEAPADLSAGRGAVTGHGNPVTTTTAGDTGTKEK